MSSQQPSKERTYCKAHGTVPGNTCCACDYENIGRALMESIAKNLPGYSWSECPSEAIVDLVNQRDDLVQENAKLQSIVTLRERVAASAPEPPCERDADLATRACQLLNSIMAIAYTASPTQAEAALAEIHKSCLKFMDHEPGRASTQPPGACLECARTTQLVETLREAKVLTDAEAKLLTPSTKSGE